MSGAFFFSNQMIVMFKFIITDNLVLIVLVLKAYFWSAGTHPRKHIMQEAATHPGQIASHIEPNVRVPMENSCKRHANTTQKEPTTSLLTTHVHDMLMTT